MERLVPPITRAAADRFVLPQALVIAAYAVAAAALSVAVCILAYAVALT